MWNSRSLSKCNREYTSMKISDSRIHTEKINVASSVELSNLLGPLHLVFWVYIISYLTECHSYHNFISSMWNFDTSRMKNVISRYCAGNGNP